LVALCGWVLAHIMFSIMAYRAKLFSMERLKMCYTEMSDAGLLEQASTSIAVSTEEARILG
jgi:hypothetical protein